MVPEIKEQGFFCLVYIWIQSGIILNQDSGINISKPLILITNLKMALFFGFLEFLSSARCKATSL